MIAKKKQKKHTSVCKTKEGGRRERAPSASPSPPWICLWLWLFTYHISFTFTVKRYLRTLLIILKTITLVSKWASFWFAKDDLLSSSYLTPYFLIDQYLLYMHIYVLETITRKTKIYGITTYIYVLYVVYILLLKFQDPFSNSIPELWEVMTGTQQTCQHISLNKLMWPLLSTTKQIIKLFQDFIKSHIIIYCNKNNKNIYKKIGVILYP